MLLLERDGMLMVMAKGRGVKEEEQCFLSLAFYGDWPWLRPSDSGGIMVELIRADTCRERGPLPHVLTPAYENRGDRGRASLITVQRAVKSCRVARVMSGASAWWALTS